MTSRPAAPESETPEVDALFEEFINAGGEKDVIDYHAIMRKLDLLARSLECRLCLAQTEIKGHMRVVDELRRDLAGEVAIVNRVWEALGIETYDAAKPFAIDEHVTLLKARIAELEKAINTPEIEDFLRGVRLESAHQIERWGSAHDREKSAENWYWLVGYLGGKALRSAITGDRDKALHHCISSAAALMNWHSAIRLDTSGAGIGKDGDIAPDGSEIEPIDAALKSRA